MIKVYPFNDAPRDLQELADQGGDEDWIVIIPQCLASDVCRYGTPHWIDAMDSNHEPVRVDMANGDIMYVGCH